MFRYKQSKISSNTEYGKKWKTERKNLCVKHFFTSESSVAFNYLCKDTYHYIKMPNIRFTQNIELIQHIESCITMLFFLVSPHSVRLYPIYPYPTYFILHPIARELSYPTSFSMREPSTTTFQIGFSLSKRSHPLCQSVIICHVLTA